MLLTELRFFIFFGLVFAVHWTLKRNDLRKYFLTLVSYVFYGFWDWKFLALIWMVTGVCYLVGSKVGPEAGLPETDRKRWLTFGILFPLLVLGIFKYFNFFADSFVDIASLFGMSVNDVMLELILPVGISFYSFQAISYVLDVSRKEVKANKQLSDIAFYIAFFPQLVAGPIVRAATFIPQMEKVRRWESVNVQFCIVLFLIGFFKKACISDNVAPFVDLVFANPGDYSGPTIVGGVFLYGVQIYCDFSGYSDMAVACSGLLGYVIPPNFKAPYFAANIQDFWRRWHISLSNWLRDYLYIPLGGSRCHPIRHKLNLMTTMLLGGLWHGASYNFIIWGGLHGSAQIIESYWRKLVASRVPAFDPLGPLMGGILTFWFVNLAWVFFRAPNLEQALQIAVSYVTWQSAGSENLPINVWQLLASLLLAHHVGNKVEMLERVSLMPRTAFTCIASAMAALSVALLPQGYRPFIYFQF